jgi:aspartyl-tRNA(Asn)/glutamyl-tRNA(Gln) amidotransferase subunit A
VTFVSVSTLHSSLRSRDTAPAAIVSSAGERRDRLNPTLNAFLSSTSTDIRVAEVDAQLKAGKVGSLAGVPVALKDNLCLVGSPTTAGSRILEGYRSPFTATAVQRLLDAGAVVIGKTNCDEFAMGSSGENSAFGPTKNPWDVSRVPGGSSSGSAAAVAAGIVPAALGSDTGGSIRQPASHCGIVGLKPTYGRVSRYGLIAYASSLDQIGPLTRSVEDAALILNIICGHDPLDSTSSDHAVPDFTQDLSKPIDELVLGVPKHAFSPANHPAVVSTLRAAIKTYESLGASIREIDFPHADHAIAAYYIVALAEASSNLARFDGVRYGRRAALKPGASLMDLYCQSRSEGFGPEVQRRIMLGTYILSSGYYDAYYLTALKARRKIKQDFDRAFEAPTSCDAILMPASPNPAFKLGEKTSDPLAMYLEDIYTVGINLAGVPAITIPAGFVAIGQKRLPIGMQLIGPAWREATLLRIARMFEGATTYHEQTPDI